MALQQELLVALWLVVEVDAKSSLFLGASYSIACFHDTIVSSVNCTCVLH